MTADTRRWREDLQAEIDGATVYRAMARSEKAPVLSAVYLKLAEAEERHAAVWEKRLRDAGSWTGALGPTWRARLLAFAARRGGAALVATTMAGGEGRDQYAYAAQTDAGVALLQGERSHARILRLIASESLGGSAIARLEGRHRATAGNALRAAVLGIDDGLISNFGLVMGVAGAGVDARALLVAGLAGMVAGALSMALGEWLSVQSARELYERQLRIKVDELAAAPEEEEDELALMYRSKGLTEGNARLMARQVMRSAGALETLSDEELRVDPGDLGGSAYVAAATSFTMFAVGALIPIIPLFFVSGTMAIVAAAVLSGVSLFCVGALITVITGRPALRAGARQLAIGVAAATITFGLGRLVGTAFA